MDIEEAILDVFQKLLDGRQKVEEEDDCVRISGYRMNDNIRIDIIYKKRK